MYSDEFKELIDKELGQTMLVEIRENKVYTAFDKTKIEDLYVKLSLLNSCLQLNEKQIKSFREFVKSNYKKDNNKYYLPNFDRCFSLAQVLDDFKSSKQNIK